jgi:hypothetical protein
MTAMWRLTHRIDETEYEVGITWDEDAFIEGSPSIRVSASVRPEDGDPITLDVSIRIQETQENGPDIVLSWRETDLIRLPLADLVDESQIIDRIPSILYGAGNPVTGCLLRAGLSAVVGQIIRCKKSTQGVEWYRPRLRQIGMCLRANIGSIGRRAAFRAAKCVLLVGT